MTPELTKAQTEAALALVAAGLELERAFAAYNAAKADHAEKLAAFHRASTGAQQEAG